MAPQIKTSDLNVTTHLSARQYLSQAIINYHADSLHCWEAGESFINPNYFVNGILVYYTEIKFYETQDVCLYHWRKPWSRSSEQFNVSSAQQRFLPPTVLAALLLMPPKHVGFGPCERHKSHRPCHLLNTSSSQNISGCLFYRQKTSSWKPEPLVSLEDRCSAVRSLTDLHHTLFNKRVEGVILPWFQWVCVMNPIEWQHPHRLLHVEKPSATIYTLASPKGPPPPFQPLENLTRTV